MVKNVQTARYNAVALIYIHTHLSTYAYVCMYMYLYSCYALQAAAFSRCGVAGMFRCLFNQPQTSASGGQESRQNRSAHQSWPTISFDAFSRHGAEFRAPSSLHG